MNSEAVNFETLNSEAVNYETLNCQAVHANSQTVNPETRNSEAVDSVPLLWQCPRHGVSHAESSWRSYLK